MGLFRLAFIVLAAAASSSGAANEVREAETAFAKAFADRDQARFFSFVAEDASFLGPNKTLSGKSQVVETWSQFFQGAKAPFSWRPERVVVNAAGDIGLSIGPIFDPAGKQTGNYSAVWQKQKDGTWKVIFDGPGSDVCLPAEKE